MRYGRQTDGSGDGAAIRQGTGALRGPAGNLLPACTGRRRWPCGRAAGGTGVVIEAQIASEEPLRKALLRFRPMDQTQPWTVLAMQHAGQDRYRATIPGNQVTAAFDLLYYREARVAGGGTLWPAWQEQTPYVKVTVRNGERSTPNLERPSRTAPSPGVRRA
jgi:hypothetical protein